MKHLGDITKLHGAELPPVDVVVGGSPCQNLSVAGNRMGLEGSESRLFYDYVRVVKEMRDADRKRGRSDEFIRPRLLVFENVFGALNSNKGKDFQIILTEIARIARPDCPDVPIPEGGWPKSGCISGVGIFGCPFSVAWRLHDGQFWGNALYDDEGNAIFRGTPQRRKRIALVADFGGLSAPEVLFVREGLSGNPQKGRETEEADSARTGGGTAEASRIYDARGNGGGGIAPTITGDHQNRITDYTAICVGNGQRDIGSHISPETSQTLSTMHDQLAVMVKDTAVAVDLYNQKVDGDKTMTLAAQRADPHHTPCVMQREE